jgi:anti-sigma factor RsiW
VHPFGDLSAYLDGALSSEARATVQAHLDTCALCRARLAELRGTALLIAALPTPVPSRSLVPRVSIPFWLAPLRTFSTFASAAAIFLFLVSAVVSSFPRMTSQGAPGAAAPAPNAVSAPQASSGAEAASATARPQVFDFAAPSSTPAPNADQLTRSAAASDAAKYVGRSSTSASPTGPEGLTRLNHTEPAPSPFIPSPWLWLILGVAFGALSFILGRRLRSG